jgi:hypothetical protein
MRVNNHCFNETIYEVDANGFVELHKLLIDLTYFYYGWPQFLSFPANKLI